MKNADKVAAKSVVNGSLSIRERVSIALQAYGTQTIICTIDDLVGATGLNGQSIYQALYGMQNAKRLEILTEPVGDSGRRKVSGVKLLKVESASSILEKVPQRMPVNNKVIRREETRIKDTVPHIMEYMDKKIVIERVKKELSNVHIDPNQLVFETDHYAEEGILLLNEWVEMKKKNTDYLIQIETLTRELNTLKGSKIYHPPDGHNDGQGNFEESKETVAV